MGSHHGNVGHTSRSKGTGQISPSEVNVGVGGATGPTGSRSAGAYPACVPCSKEQGLANRGLPFPILPETLPRKGGGLSAGQALPRPAPMLHMAPTHGMQQDGDWSIPPAPFPPCHFLCPRYKLTHRHKVPRNSLMALSLSLQVCAGYTLDLLLVILFLVSLPHRQSNTQTSPSTSHNGGGALSFIFVVKLRSPFPPSCHAPTRTHMQTDGQTDRQTHTRTRKYTQKC